MSLVEQPIPSREPVRSRTEEEVVVLDMEEAVEQQRSSYRDSSSLSDAPRSLYTNDSYGDDMLSDYYDDVMGREPEKSQETEAPEAPALPAKSNLRASRLLDGFALKVDPEEQTTLNRATPQEVYLSSEEDASSSADEFSDYDFDSESDEAEGTPGSRRGSREDTARMVSVIFIGKPSIIDLPAARRPVSPPSPREQRRQSRIVLTSTESSLLRRLSMSSTSTGLSVPSPHHPPRSSSMLSSMLSKPRPSFLTIDPFASKAYHDRVEEERGEADTPITPKTPTAMLKRGLSIVRKRSKHNLRDMRDVGPDDLRSPSTTTLPLDLEDGRGSFHSDAVPHTPPRQGGTYNDIMKSAKRHGRVAQQGSPASSSAHSPSQSFSSGRSKLLGSFHRRKSIKA